MLPDVLRELLRNQHLGAAGRQQSAAIKGRVCVGSAAAVAETGAVAVGEQPLEGRAGSSQSLGLTL
eukprot:3390483-Pleurochrysis_carterae.AAC.1